RESGGRGRGLDAKPSLPRTPEEARSLRIKPVGWDSRRRERPQTRPFALDRFDGPVDHRLKVIDCAGNVDFLGRGVARLARGLVMRAHPNAIVALALEIESAQSIDHERQVLEPLPSDAELDDRSP